MLIQPFVNYNMPRGWYLVSSRFVTANWKSESSNRWSVPLGGGLGRVFRIGKQPLNTHVQAFYHAVHPDGAASWSFRVQAQLLFPK